jgi:hypothetical protein
MGSNLYAKLKTTNVVQTAGPWDKLELPIQFKIVNRQEHKLTCDVCCLGVHMTRWELTEKGLASDVRAPFGMFQEDQLGLPGTYSVKGLARSSLYMLSDLLAMGVTVQRNGYVNLDEKQVRLTLEDNVVLKMSPRVVWGTFEAHTQALVVVIKMIGKLHFAMRVQDQAATIMVLADKPFEPETAEKSPTAVWAACKERAIHVRVLGTKDGERIWKSLPSAA